MIGKLRVPPEGFRDSVLAYLQKVAQDNSGSATAAKRRAIAQGAASRTMDLGRYSAPLVALFSSSHGGVEFVPSSAQLEVVDEIPTYPRWSGEDDLLTLLAAVEFAARVDSIPGFEALAHEAQQKSSSYERALVNAKARLDDLQAERDNLHGAVMQQERTLEARDEQLADAAKEINHLEEVVATLGRSGLSTEKARPPAKKRREPVEGHPGIYQRKLADGTVVFEIAEKKKNEAGDWQTTYSRVDGTLEDAVAKRAELRGED